MLLLLLLFEFWLLLLLFELILLMTTFTTATTKLRNPKADMGWPLSLHEFLDSVGINTTGICVGEIADLLFTLLTSSEWRWSWQYFTTLSIPPPFLQSVPPSLLRHCFSRTSSKFTRLKRKVWEISFSSKDDESIDCPPVGFIILQE